MDAFIPLVGVVLGALLAPSLEWIRQRRIKREQQRTQLLELVADLISISGDRLMAARADPELRQWSAEIGFRANQARWRLRLLSPPEVARAADAYGHASTELERRIQSVGEWEDDRLAAAWAAWQKAAEDLVGTARRHLDHL